MGTAQLENLAPNSKGHSEEPSKCSESLAAYIQRSEPLHLAAISALAHEVQRPIGEIRSAYYAELSHFARGATVFDFLPVLVMKRLRERYKARVAALRKAGLFW